MNPRILFAAALAACACGNGSLRVESDGRSEVDAPLGVTAAPCAAGKVAAQTFCANPGALLKQIPLECPYVKIKAWGGGAEASTASGGGGAFAQLRFINRQGAGIGPGGVRLMLAPGCYASSVSGQCTNRHGESAFVRLLQPDGAAPLLLVAAGGGAPGSISAWPGDAGRGTAGGQLLDGEGAGPSPGGGFATELAAGAGGKCSGSGCYDGGDGSGTYVGYCNNVAWGECPGVGGTGGQKGTSAGLVLGGHGGNGWFGGGGGALVVVNDAGHWRAGAGGGSSHARPELVPDASVTMVAGEWNVPGNASDPDRGTGGAGGIPPYAPAAGTCAAWSGQSGRLVVEWRGTPFEDCALPAIQGPGQVVAGSSGNVAQVVNPDPASSWRWSITGGSIESGDGTPAVRFTAFPGSTLVRLTVVEENESCGVSPPASLRISVVNCAADSDCHAGEVCESCGAGAFCVAGCRTDADCAAPQTCKPVTCVACPCPSRCAK